MKENAKYLVAIPLCIRWNDEVDNPKLTYLTA